MQSRRPKNHALIALTDADLRSCFPLLLRTLQGSDLRKVEANMSLELFGFLLVHTRRLLQIASMLYYTHVNLMPMNQLALQHVTRFSTSNLTALKLLTQENVLVGGFFVISGYVSAYTTTRLGALGVEEKKIANPELFFWQRTQSYYPLHFVSSALCAPMFIWVERNFNASWNMIAFRAFLNFSMLQAWFPKEAEIWNQPTWFLSALTFSNLTMPTLVLPTVANLSKKGLEKLNGALWAVSMLQKVSYSETARFHSSNEHPVDGKVLMPLIWNLTRFHPIWALFEMTSGIVAARHVMLDTEEEEKRQPTNPLWFFLAAYSSLALRLTRFDFNDAIIRGVVFVPLFTKFLTAMHRDALTPSPRAITKFFGCKTMATLGSLVSWPDLGTRFLQMG